MTLKVSRKKRGMTRKEFAGLANITLSALDSYESGNRRPPPEVAARIAQILGWDIETMWQMFYEPGQTIESP